MGDTRCRRLAGVCSLFLFVVGTVLPWEITSGSLQLTTKGFRLVLFAIVYGFAFGASYTLVSSLPAKMFGKKPEFSQLQAFFILFQVFGGFAGTLVTGKLRSMTGSFALPFSIFSVMAVLAFLHYLLLDGGSGSDGCACRPKQAR